MTAAAPHADALSAEEVRALSAHAITRTYPKSTVIMHEGDPADSLYVIVSGRVKVFVADSTGKEIVLSTQGPGEYFGEMMLDEGPRSASVMTMEKSVFLVVPKADLREFLVRNPEFAVHFIEKLIHRVRSLTASVKSLALMDVYGRVARLLLDLAEERQGAFLIRERLTHAEIANRVGASREMVSRILKDLSTGGYLTQSRSGMVLHRKPPPKW